jgi:hypothetical protein
MEVVQTETGWAVVDSGGRVVKEFVSNSQAWRFLDRNDEAGDAYDRIRMCFNGGYQRGGA